MSVTKRLPKINFKTEAVDVRHLNLQNRCSFSLIEMPSYCEEKTTFSWTLQNSTRPDINGVAPELSCNARRGKLWCLTVLLQSIYVFVVRPVSVPTCPTRASPVLLTQSRSSPVLPTFDALRNVSQWLYLLMPHGKASQLCENGFLLWCESIS